jgi:hypothetical protein
VLQDENSRHAGDFTTNVLTGVVREG